MSLAAPPHLIEKSLQAASDELQHAKKSFEMASLLMGDQILEGSYLLRDLNLETILHRWLLLLHKNGVSMKPYRLFGLHCRLTWILVQ